MRNGYMKALTLGFSSLALFACNETPTKPDAAAAGRNNSDPAKSSFKPMDGDGRAYLQRKEDMLKKIDPQWAGHLAQAEIADASGLAKTAAAGTVGILANTGWGYTDATYMQVYMDTENDDNGDVLSRPYSSDNLLQVVGVKRLPSPDHNGGMLFRFQKRTLTSLPILKYDYILPLFSDVCPTNGIRFGEIFDNEDTQNQDYASSTVYPGWSRRDWTGTRLEFCFVPGNSSLPNTIVPPWGGDERGAFGLPGMDYYTGCALNDRSSKVLMDGEDDGWAGSFEWEDVPVQYQSRVNAIMDNQYGAPTFNITECHVPVSSR